MALSRVGLVLFACFVTTNVRPVHCQTTLHMPVESAAKHIDLHGDPLPDGALRRLGTLQRRAVDARLVISADGKWIIGVCGGKYVSIWDAASGHLREITELPVDRWSFSELSRDGRWLVNSVQDRLTVWEFQGGKFVHRSTLPGQADLQATLSPDGKLLGVAGYGRKDLQLQVWDIAAGQEVFSKNGITGDPSQEFAFSPDATRLVGYGHCWEIATGRLIWQNRGCPLPITITPDGKILRPPDGCLDLATGKPGPKMALPTLTPGDRLTIIPDGRTLLRSSAEGVLVWDLVQGKPLRNLVGAGEEIAIAPDGKSIATNKGMIQRWDLATGKPFYQDNSAQGHIDEVTNLRFCAGGKRLVSAGRDGSVRLWDVATGRPIHVWWAHNARRPMWHFWEQDDAGVDTFDLTPDGSRLVSAGSGGCLKVWDMATGQEARSIPLPKLAWFRGSTKEEGRHVVHQLRVSARGEKAEALFDASGTAWYSGIPGPGDELLPAPHAHLVSWDLTTGKVLKRQAVHGHCLSPDGTLMLQENTLTLVGSGKEWCRLEPALPDNQGGNLQVFSRDGQLLAGIASPKNRKDGGVLLCVWEVHTGKIVCRVNARSAVGQVAFLADSRFLIANGLDGIQVWDLLTSAVVFSRPLQERVRWSNSQDAYASSFAVSPEGGLFATGHPDSTILLWPFKLPPRRPAELTLGELESLWLDLASPNAGKGWHAAWRMMEWPREAVTFLGSHLKPIQPAPAQQIRPLIAELDSDSFLQREAATQQLRQLGHRAGDAVRAALKDKPSLEKERRLLALVADLEGTAPSLTMETLRACRAVVVLERAGSLEAQQVLTSLAKGLPADRLTHEAMASMERLLDRLGASD